MNPPPQSAMAITVALAAILVTAGCGGLRSVSESEAVTMTVERVDAARYRVTFGDLVTRLETTGAIATGGAGKQTWSSSRSGPSLVLESGTWGEMTIGADPPSENTMEKQRISLRLGAEDVHVDLPSEGIAVRLVLERISDALVEVHGVYAVRQVAGGSHLRLVPLMTSVPIGQETAVYTSRPSGIDLRGEAGSKR